MERLFGLFCNCEAHPGSLCQHGTLSSALHFCLSKQWLLCHFLFDVNTQISLPLFCFYHMFWQHSFPAHYPSSSEVCAIILSAAISVFRAPLPKKRNKEEVSSAAVESLDSISVFTLRSLSDPVLFCTIS